MGLPRLLRMISGVDGVSPGRVGMVSGLFVLPTVMMLSCFAVVASGLCMVFGCFFMMLGCFF